MARQLHIPDYDRVSTVGRKGDEVAALRNGERCERGRIRRAIAAILRSVEDNATDAPPERIW
jgi:hypothetical protein